MNQKEQLAAMIKCLKQAKEHLSDGSREKKYKTDLICFAIDKVQINEAGGWGIHGRVKRAIHIALDGKSTFCAWLNVQLGYKAFSALSQREIQQLRHKWINRIIRDWTKIWEAME